MKNIIDLKIDEIKIREEYPPYKCKMCGESLIEDSQQICTICGWQDCDMLYQHPDYFGGPSILSFNQYKNVYTLQRYFRGPCPERCQEENDCRLGS